MDENEAFAEEMAPLIWEVMQDDWSHPGMELYDSKTIPLTPDQQAVLANNGTRPVCAIDPRTKKEYVLVNREAFERIQALLSKGGKP